MMESFVLMSVFAGGTQSPPEQVAIRREKYFRVHRNRAM